MSHSVLKLRPSPDAEQAVAVPMLSPRMREYYSDLGMDPDKAAADYEQAAAKNARPADRVSQQIALVPART